MIGKAAIFLKHRAGKIGGMFRGKDLKNKTTIAKFKAKKVGSTIGSRAKNIVSNEIKYIKQNPIESSVMYGGATALGLAIRNSRKKKEKNNGKR